MRGMTRFNMGEDSWDVQGWDYGGDKKCRQF